MSETGEEVQETVSKAGTGRLQDFGRLCCACCLHEKYRFCWPCKFSLVGCTACCCWSLVGMIAFYLLLYLAVLKPLVCDALKGEMFPEQSWLKVVAPRTPSNWQWAGSQVDGCLEWMSKINISDWRTEEAEWQEVFFPTASGLQLHGFFFPGKAGAGLAGGTTGAKQAPTILQIHGHGPYAAQQTQMQPAKAMSDRGFNVLTLNNRGLGKSEQPPEGTAMRTFGSDELQDTEAALKLLTENADGTLPFATPLERVGIFTESGGNGMVFFFRKDIKGLIMQGSIYDWFTRFKNDAPVVFPGFEEAVADCLTNYKESGNFKDTNYKDQLQKDVHDPSGRRVFHIHNREDKYNLFEENAVNWERDLKGKGFEVSSYYPSEAGPEGADACNNHITLGYGPQRKVFFQKMCEFWESTFEVNASCLGVAHFDRFL